MHISGYILTVMLMSSTYNPLPTYTSSTESTSSSGNCVINALSFICACMHGYMFQSILSAGSPVLPVAAGATIILLVVITVTIFVVLLVIIR